MFQMHWLIPIQNAPIGRLNNPIEILKWIAYG